MNVNAKISLLGYLSAISASLALNYFISYPFVTILLEILTIAVFYLFFKTLDLENHFKDRECLLNLYHALGLGILMGGNIVLSVNSFQGHLENYIWPFSAFLCVLSFFHWSEYFVTAVYNERSLSISVYMILHSTEYLTAMAASSVEYWFEVGLVRRYDLPQAPDNLRLLALVLCFSFDLFRKFAMMTAASNFNHQVEYISREDHVLVDTGIYSLFRHPAYFGWFYWSVFTQVLLVNPICMVLYPIASYCFFSERIILEERALISFFGGKYIEYQKRVQTGVPFVKGYQK